MRPITRVRVEARKRKARAIPDPPIHPNLPILVDPQIKARAPALILHHPRRKNPKKHRALKKQEVAFFYFCAHGQSVLILLADGFEEIEATAPIDLLRRVEAEGYRGFRLIVVSSPVVRDLQQADALFQISGILLAMICW